LTGPAAPFALDPDLPVHKSAAFPYDDPPRLVRLIRTVHPKAAGMNRERYSMASVEMATPIPWWGEPMLIGCVIGAVNWCLALFFGPETKGKEMVR
jgi:hypothetical protein